MKRLQKNLLSMTDEILNLAVKVDKIEKRITKLEKSQKPAVEEKTGKGINKGINKGTATSAVLAAIGRSRKGVTTGMIKEKTGFDEKKIYNIVNRLKSMGMIKSAGYGLYMKV